MFREMRINLAIKMIYWAARVAPGEGPGHGLRIHILEFLLCKKCQDREFHCTHEEERHD